MATGEYDFNGQFHVSPGGESEEQDELAYLPITTAIWVIFIAVMPVLFINMLVGVRDFCTETFVQIVSLFQIGNIRDCIFCYHTDWSGCG